MKMCDEMMKLRNAIDEKGIQWEDKSTIYPEEDILKIMRECREPHGTAHTATQG